MPSIYENFDGHEAIEVLSEKFGLKPQTKQEFLPRLRECPNVTCKELNIPDAPFCVKCRVPLTVAGHIEQGHQKEKEMQALRNEMVQSKQEIKDRFQAYEDKMAEFIHDIQSRLNQEETSRPYRHLMLDKMREILDRTAPGWFQEVFGPKASRLSPEANEKIKEWLKILNPQIDAENREREVEIQNQRKVLMDSMGTNV